MARSLGIQRKNWRTGTINIPVGKKIVVFQGNNPINGGAKVSSIFRQRAMSMQVSTHRMKKLA